MIGELKNNRLKKTWDFQKILKERQKIYNKNFIIFYRRNPLQTNLYRFGISIPQKIIKKVVLRNKYKRQVKHALFELQSEKTKEWRRLGGWDFLIIVKESFPTESFSTKKNSLGELFNFFIRKNSNKHLIDKELSRRKKGFYNYFEKDKDRS